MMRRMDLGLPVFFAMLAVAILTDREQLRVTRQAWRGASVTTRVILVGRLAWIGFIRINFVVFLIIVVGAVYLGVTGHSIGW